MIIVRDCREARARIPPSRPRLVTTRPRTGTPAPVLPSHRPCPEQLPRPFPGRCGTRGPRSLRRTQAATPTESPGPGPDPHCDTSESHSESAPDHQCQ